MSRTVFILGAGASRSAGGPLMADFLDLADNLRRRRQELGDDAASFDLVFKGLGALDAAHAKAVLDVDNIESVYGAFEMARLCGRLGNWGPEEIARLGPAVRRLIVKTLEKAIGYPVVNSAISPPRPYEQFGQLLSRLNDRGLGQISYITFNYDLALDFLMHFTGQRVDYFGTPAYTGAPIMKLHGSLNWARCAKCKAVVPWQLVDFFARSSWVLLPGVASVPLEVGSKLTYAQHCGEACQPDPVIVPPTWNKAEYHEVVQVWQQAAKHLSEAEHIVVVGYSLPETDQFFRYLYAVGTIGDARLKHFLVVDPSEDSAKRFQALLGPTARARFGHIPREFNESLAELDEELGRR